MCVWHKCMWLYQCGDDQGDGFSSFVASRLPHCKFLRWDWLPCQPLFQPLHLPAHTKTHICISTLMNLKLNVTLTWALKPHADLLRTAVPMIQKCFHFPNVLPTLVKSVLSLFPHALVHFYVYFLQYILEIDLWISLRDLIWRYCGDIIHGSMRRTDLKSSVTSSPVFFTSSSDIMLRMAAFWYT